VPLYDFVCECGQEFEELLMGSEQIECPACQSTALQRKLPVFAVGGSVSASADPSDCGTCGDPRGPGS